MKPPEIGELVFVVSTPEGVKTYRQFIHIEPAGPRLHGCIGPGRYLEGVGRVTVADNDSRHCQIERLPDNSPEVQAFLNRHGWEYVEGSKYLRHLDDPARHTLKARLKRKWVGKLQERHA